MLIKRIHILACIVISFPSLAMHPSAKEAEKIFKTISAKEIKKIFKALKEPKKYQECKSLVTEGRQQDQLTRNVQRLDSTPSIYAPWRDSYKAAERSQPAPTQAQAEAATKPACPFCDQFSRPEDDKSNYIVERHEHSVVMFNRNPYLPLHLLLIPFEHTKSMKDVRHATRNEILRNAQRWLKRLRKIGVKGANFFFNVESKSAGASLPDHIHAQFLSRWDGDNSALAYLLANKIIQAERSLLLSYFSYVYEGKEQEQYNGKKLAQVYKPFSRILAIEYEQSDHESETSNCRCYICDVHNNPRDDAQNLVVNRYRYWNTMLNRAGYTGGHLLITSKRHTQFDRLTQEEIDELDHILVTEQEVLKSVVKPDGLNIALTEGECAGTPLANHVCWHIVPRIVNDTSTTAVLCGRPIIEKNLDTLRTRLIDAHLRDIYSQPVLVGK